jgi:Ca2+-binding RTX toxin-like protein
VNVSTGEGEDYVSLYQTSGGTINTGNDDDFASGGVGEHSNAFLNIFLGAGNDNGYGGRNTNLFGGSGDDYLSITGGNQASGGDGADTIYVNLEYDYLLGQTIDASSTVYGGLGDDAIYGGFADTLHGGDGNDLLQAQRGNTFLYGGNGDDLIYGGSDADWISGGTGDDALYATDLGFGFENDDDASNANDMVFGGAGSDRLFADRSGHSLFGGSGNDQIEVSILYSHSGGDSQLFGGTGHDMIQAAGSSTVTGGTGNDVFTVDTRTNGFDVENVMRITDFVQGEDKLAILSDLGSHQDILNNNEFNLYVSFNTNEAYGDHTVVSLLTDGGSTNLGPLFVLDGWIPVSESDYLPLVDMV